MSQDELHYEINIDLVELRRALLSEVVTPAWLAMDVGGSRIPTMKQREEEATQNRFKVAQEQIGKLGLNRNSRS
jgi:hypothetical protein